MENFHSCKIQCKVTCGVTGNTQQPSQYTLVPLSFSCEVWVMHEQGLDPPLGANSNQTGKEDWHWSHQSRCPRSYVLNFTHFWHKFCNKCDCSIVSLHNVSGWSFFLGWLCSTEPILGSHTLSCQTVTCACFLHARKESSQDCMALPWIQQPSIVWPFLLFFFFFFSATTHSEKEQKLWFTKNDLLGCTAWG